LLCQTYGRAVIMKGGIIRCLAHASLVDRADFLITHGPSENVIQFGSCIKIEDGRYWDDDLEYENKEIICGMYKLSTDNIFQSFFGQRHHQNWKQTADVLWWPKQSIWEACGLNVGYWSTDNEVWYQKYLQKICKYDRTSPPPYCISSEWQKALKYCKDTTKRVCDYCMQATENWLAIHT
ncbi:hypothetical protein HD554DRAFT_2026204, partial [Boletus coccyginus]